MSDEPIYPSDELLENVGRWTLPDRWRAWAESYKDWGTALCDTLTFSGEAKRLRAAGQDFARVKRGRDFCHAEQGRAWETFSLLGKEMEAISCQLLQESPADVGLLPVLEVEKNPPDDKEACDLARQMRGLYGVLVARRRRATSGTRSSSDDPQESPPLSAARRKAQPLVQRILAYMEGWPSARVATFYKCCWKGKDYSESATRSIRSAIWRVNNVLEEEGSIRELCFNVPFGIVEWVPSDDTNG